jgi:hypothetical protein
VRRYEPRTRSTLRYQMLTRTVGGVWSVLLATASLALCAVFGLAAAMPENVKDVSIVQLLATPERYEGRRVRLKGFCHFEFEEHALYLHREDSEVLNRNNGVWLDSSSLGDHLNETFVLVEGTFTSKAHGHLGAWPGEIQRITRLEHLRSREEYEEMLKKGPPPPRR